MHLVTCTCGREYNADELIRCPVCSTLTHDVVKASTASTTNEAKATTLPGASLPKASNSEERVMRQVLNAQVATMNYTRVLALVVMLLFVNAFWGAVVFVIVATAGPYDDPNAGLIGFVALLWLGSFATIAWLIGSAMSDAREARRAVK